MTTFIKSKATIDDFMTFIEQSENGDRIFEFINGEIIEVPSNPFVSNIANLISFFIRLFLRENSLKGHVTGADGGFIIEGRVFAPDLAYISHVRMPELTRKGFGPVPPELVVEVLSDPHNNSEQAVLRRKLAYYLRAGMVVWVVDYVAQQVDVHLPNGESMIYTAQDTISGGDVLPGFELTIAEIFPKSDGA